MQANHRPGVEEEFLGESLSRAAPRGDLAGKDSAPVNHDLVVECSAEEEREDDEEHPHGLQRRPETASRRRSEDRGPQEEDQRSVGGFGQ